MLPHRLVFPAATVGVPQVLAACKSLRGIHLGGDATPRVTGHMPCLSGRSQYRSQLPRIVPSQRLIPSSLQHFAAHAIQN